MAHDRATVRDGGESYWARMGILRLWTPVRPTAVQSPGVHVSEPVLPRPGTRRAAVVATAASGTLPRAVHAGPATGVAGTTPAKGERSEGLAPPTTPTDGQGRRAEAGESLAPGEASGDGRASHAVGARREGGDARPAWALRSTVSGAAAAQPVSFGGSGTLGSDPSFALLRGEFAR